MANWQTPKTLIPSLRVIYGSRITPLTSCGIEQIFRREMLKKH
jgi:hypothetical protein